MLGFFHLYALCKGGLNVLRGQRGRSRCLGWDEASAFLKIRSGGGWVTYRLPKAAEAFDRAAAGDQRLVEQIRSRFGSSRGGPTPRGDQEGLENEDHGS